jgi:hypothetical protein
VVTSLIGATAAFRVVVVRAMQFQASQTVRTMDERSFALTACSKKCRPAPAHVCINHSCSFIELTNALLVACRWRALNDWLVEDYLVLGIVPFQNWMWMAIVIVILGIVAGW